MRIKTGGRIQSLLSEGLNSTVGFGKIYFQLPKIRLELRFSIHPPINKTLIWTLKRLDREWAFSYTRRVTSYGLLEKWLNSSAFHADIHGFESRTGHSWTISSVGRASALQAEGRRFEPVIVHCGAVAQLVRAPACHAGGRGFETHLRRRHCSAMSFLLKWYNQDGPLSHWENEHPHR